MTRKSWNLFTNMVVLSFISYASTELPPELMFRITWLFAYCFLWYNDMKIVLARNSRSWKLLFRKHKTRQNSYAQLYRYPFQSHTYEIQTHSYPLHCELAQIWCLRRSLDWFIFLGSFMYTSINQNPWNVAAKQHYTPLKRKKRMNNIQALSKTKREEEEVEI